MRDRARTCRASPCRTAEAAVPAWASALFGIWVTQITLYCEIFAETVQVHVADLRGLTHPGKARACGEGNGSGSGKNFGSVVEKNLVDSVGCESGPVYGGTAFDHDAGDLQFCQAAENRR